VKVPTIHLNGSDADVLYKQARTADRALRTALEALYAMGPNGRDYYPQGDGAFEAACKEHNARIDRVIAVQEEIIVLAANVLEQRDARNALKAGRP
jgi:hypothetical protein